MAQEPGEVGRGFNEQDLEIDALMQSGGDGGPGFEPTGVWELSGPIHSYLRGNVFIYFTLRL